MVFANRDSKSSLLGTLLGTGREDSTQRALEDSSLGILANGENIQPSFDLHIRSLQFSSFEDFKSRLPDFYSLNNVKYKVATGLSFVTGNSQKFKEDDPNSSKLVYKRLLLVCVLYASRYRKTVKTGFPRFSKFTVGCRASITFVSNKDVMKILAFNMKHNHVCGSDLKMLCKRRARTEIPLLGRLENAFREESSAHCLSTQSTFETAMHKCILLTNFVVALRGLARSVRTNCPCRIGFRYDGKGFALWHFNVVHNHETVGDLIGHWTTTVGDYDRRFEYVSTLLNLKIPCQIIQICVKRRFGLSMCLADIRRMQRKRRCVCDSSEVECDEYDASSHPSGLETYMDYGCPFGYCDWEETNYPSRNTKRRKSMRSVLVRSEGCRKQSRRPFGSRHKNMQILVKERTAKPHEQTRRR
ncbi:unnamed protein product [Taenia asiatica]|uniref:DBD_Tnp_Mut domain-containing protein n=1 Tax=Taenia asiatica TaxID=60517 RepID=A0A0R3W161_TAEAS|nr:unnamed protein product [Taenia asiatica]